MFTTTFLLLTLFSSKHNAILLEYVGNILFRDEVKKVQTKYNVCNMSCSLKREFSQRIVGLIKSRGGRFLRELEVSSSFKKSLLLGGQDGPAWNYGRSARKPHHPRGASGNLYMEVSDDVAIEKTKQCFRHLHRRFGVSCSNLVPQVLDNDSQEDRSRRRSTEDDDKTITEAPENPQKEQDQDNVDPDDDDSNVISQDGHPARNQSGDLTKKKHRRGELCGHASEETPMSSSTDSARSFVHGNAIKDWRQEWRQTTESAASRNHQYFVSSAPLHVHRELSAYGPNQQESQTNLASKRSRFGLRPSVGPNIPPHHSSPARLPVVVPVNPRMMTSLPPPPRFIPPLPFPTCGMPPSTCFVNSGLPCMYHDDGSSARWQPMLMQPTAWYPVEAGPGPGPVFLIPAGDDASFGFQGIIPHAH